MDFTPKKYRELLKALDGYEVTLRHDVDKRPLHSLRIAQIEKEENKKSIYYFRTVPCSYDETTIRQISQLGHEIGYHYENLATCNGDYDAAWTDFCNNLEKLRKIAPIRTACMHGSPKSKYDSRDLLKKNDYHATGIDYEPYLDTDWNTCFYLTDTGRRWDGWKVSVRDKITGFQEQWEEQGLVFHTTDDIIAAANEHKLPHKIMLVTHPQRWQPFGIKWIIELIIQQAKNIVKTYLIRHRKATCQEKKL